MPAFETALSQAPDREATLFALGSLTKQRNRADDALRYWKRTVEINPWDWRYHSELASLYANRREWTSAAAECEAALRLNAADWDTRKLLVTCYLRQGKQEHAGREFRRLLGFQPPNPDALSRWYQEERARSNP